MSNQSIINFYTYLSNHPSLDNKEGGGTLLFGCSKAYTEQVNALSDYALENQLPYKIHVVCFDEVKSSYILEYINSCDCFVFWYDAITLNKPNPKGPEVIQPLLPKMRENWKKSIIFKDYHDKFYQAFSIAPARIYEINQKLISQACESSEIKVKNNNGTSISFSPTNSQKWTNINGNGNYDLIPGEIATHSDSINGVVFFTGTFLSTIPFARKYGVITQPLQFEIVNSTIINAFSENQELEDDFKHYLKQNPSNSKIEEFGIGTNEAVKSLYGQNAGLEERHCGLHLGLGGGQVGSHHLDLIFTHSEIWFDQHCIFDGSSFSLSEAQLI